jgi:cytochrome d ubiquinol oxidase subunit I
VLSLATGHESAQGVARNQPVKLAAFEGLWGTTPQAPLHIFGWVDERNERTHGPAITGLLSWLAYGDSARPVTGLKEIPIDQRPPVNFSFQLFHLMVGVGFGMIGIAAWAGYALWRRRLEDSRLLLWLLTFSVLGPQIANQAGWWAAEVGRQPWIVYNLLRTSAALSAVVTANQVAASIVMFMIVYLLLFAVFLFLLNDKIKHGPDEADLVPGGKLAPGLAVKDGLSND